MGPPSAEAGVGVSYRLGWAVGKGRGVGVWTLDITEDMDLTLAFVFFFLKNMFLSLKNTLDFSKLRNQI